MQRRLCEMSEAKWSIAEAKCLQMSHNNMHPSGMRLRWQKDIWWCRIPLECIILAHLIAGISKRFHFASLHCIFSAYLPTHIKFLTEFHAVAPHLYYSRIQLLGMYLVWSSEASSGGVDGAGSGDWVVCFAFDSRCVISSCNSLCTFVMPSLLR